MENNIQPNTPRGNRNVTLGVILLAIGGIYLLNQIAGFILPYWLFSWPMLLMAIGFAIGVKHNFRRPGAFILVAIGAVGLTNMIVGYHLIVLWPLIFIAIGIRMVFFKDSHWCHSRWERRNQWRQHPYTDYKDQL
jgi:hypothetical protein